MSRLVFMLFVCAVAGALVLAWWALGLISPMLFLLGF